MPPRPAAPRGRRQRQLLSRKQRRSGGGERERKKVMAEEKTAPRNVNEVPSASCTHTCSTSQRDPHPRRLPSMALSWRARRRRASGTRRSSCDRRLIFRVKYSGGPKTELAEEKKWPDIIILYITSSPSFLRRAPAAPSPFFRCCSSRFLHEATRRRGGRHREGLTMTNNWAALSRSGDRGSDRNLC